MVSTRREDEGRKFALTRNKGGTVNTTGLKDKTKEEGTSYYNPTEAYVDPTIFSPITASTAHTRLVRSQATKPFNSQLTMQLTK